jgi:hypothetical protein
MLPGGLNGLALIGTFLFRSIACLAISHIQTSSPINAALVLYALLDLLVNLVTPGMIPAAPPFRRGYAEKNVIRPHGFCYSGSVPRKNVSSRLLNRTNPFKQSRAD